MPNIRVGQIYDQSPSEGRTVKSGATIEVKVSQGTELGTIPVVMGKDPDTVGKCSPGRGLYPDHPVGGLQQCGAVRSGMRHQPRRGQ